jgi:hypothetical protein
MGVTYRELVSCPRLSDVREYWESNEGAFLDIYVLSTTVDEWQQLIETVRGRAWPSSYYLDHEPAPMPSDVREIFAHREVANCLWQIRPSSDLWINCNFFDQEEIEFSVDPREIDAQQHLDTMCEFISTIGRTLGKPVLACIEGEPRAPAMMRYEPATDDVVASPGPWW